MNEQYIVDLKVNAKGASSAAKKIKELEAEMAKLEKTSESYKQKQIEVGRVQSAAGQSNAALGKSVSSAKDSIGGLAGGLSVLPTILTTVGVSILATVSKFLDLEKRITTLQDSISRASGLIGGSLEKVTVKVSSLASTFNKDANEITKAADAFSKQTGISFAKALSLIEKGFLQGADGGGRFLDNLREYPVQFKNAGFAAEEFIKIATQEATGGVFDDKLLDSIKELGLSLQELDKAQVDALTGAFGKEFSDNLVKGLKSGSLTAVQALQRIGAESDKIFLDEQQKAKLTADLFKSAGQDAGSYEEVIKQINAAQAINLNTLDKLGTKQKAQLTVQEALEKQQVRLATTFSGFSTLVNNLSTETLTGFLAAVNAIAAEFDILDTKTNATANNFVSTFEDKTLEEVTAELKTQRAGYIALGESISAINARKEKLRDLDTEQFTLSRQRSAAEDNQARIKIQLQGLEEIQLKKAQERRGTDQQARIAAAKAAAVLALQTEAERKKAEEDAKKAQADFIKRQKELIELEKKRFDSLKQSFENNFELARLEAQKQFAAGLITEGELAKKLFDIGQQESAVLITIIGNKKEIAKTGQEGLEISKEQLAIIEAQKKELDRIVAFENRRIESARNLRSAETDIRLNENKIELEQATQEVLTDVSIKGEEAKGLAIEAVRKKFAEKERMIRVDSLKQQVKDAQASISTLSAGDTNTDTEEGLINSEAIANATKELTGYRAELEALETQQLEAANALDAVTGNSLDKIASRAEQINGYIQQVTEGFQQALEADIALTESKLDQQEVRIQAGVELAKLGNDELLNQELERQDKILEERKKQAQKEKAIAAIQAAANLAVAITKAAAEGGGFLSAATIAATLGAVGVGIASISGILAGAFAEGVIDFKGKGTGTSDSNIVAISSGESVITAKGTQNASKMLTMINEGKLKDSDYLASGLNLEMIEDSGGMIDIRTELNEQISISRDLLAEMQNFEKKVNFSAEGVTEYVTTRNKITKKLNTR
jgi:hypothetical protein